MVYVVPIKVEWKLVDVRYIQYLTALLVKIPGSSFIFVNAQIHTTTQSIPRVADFLSDIRLYSRTHTRLY